MKFRIIFMFILISLMGQELNAQGYKIIGKNGRTYTWNYKDIDSLVVNDYKSYKVYKDGKIIQTISLSEVDNLTAFDASEKEQETSVKINGYEFVDLGLPSGLLWATCNIGADSPEDIGDYYSWGETETKSTYAWSTYKWCRGSSNSITKYNELNCELKSGDDVASVKWGGTWRMPTKKEMDELSYNCRWQATTQNGIKGILVVGKNNKSIFLPYSGWYSGKSTKNVGKSGGIWSKTNGWSVIYNAVSLVFDSSSHKSGNSDRAQGFPVRPVAPK